MLHREITYRVNSSKAQLYTSANNGDKLVLNTRDKKMNGDFVYMGQLSSLTHPKYRKNDLDQIEIRAQTALIEPFKYHWFT